MPVYAVDRVIMQTNRLFGDEEHIIYVNGAYKGEDDLGLLMADFRATDPGKIHFPELAERIRHFKLTEGGRDTMCKVMEEVREEGMKQGKAEGWKEEFLSTIQALYDAGQTLPFMMRITRRTKDEVLDGLHMLNLAAPSPLE